MSGRILLFFLSALNVGGAITTTMLNSCGWSRFLPGWVWLGQNLLVLTKGGKHNKCLLGRS
jgi:hypothetical protein